MQIPPQTLTVTLSGPNPRPSGWNPGQVLEALVVRTHPTDHSRAEIRIGKLQLTVELPVRVTEGGRLTLQVVRGGDRPVLAVLDRAGGSTTASPQGDASPAPRSGPAAAPASAGAITTRLSALLPLQGSQAPLLAGLSWLAADAERMQALPKPVRDAVEAFLRHVPTVDEAIRADGLRRIVRTSGLFHEAALAVAAAPAGGSESVPAGNLKSALLSLATRLRAHAPPSPPGTAPRPVDIPPPRPGQGPLPQPRAEAGLAQLGQDTMLEALRARTESALARLALHQWNAAESGETGQPRWLVELPLHRAQGLDLIHLLLEREPQRGETGEAPTWRAELALDLPELGPVHVHVAVTGERVQTRFWAQSGETVRRIRAGLPGLKESLEGRSLQVRDLGCNPGHPPRRGASPARGPLLDDHA